MDIILNFKAILGLILFGLIAIPSSYSFAPINNGDPSKDVSLVAPSLPFGFNTVVIDPGHGGIDEGCAVNGIKEKDIALSIALELGKKLKTTYPEINVVYTRQNDQFISLRNRINLANSTQADLFISIHCNYVAEKYVQGSETYVSGFETENVALVNKEEDKFYKDDFIKSVQFKRLENNSYVKSLDLASKIESSFASLKGMESRGVRHGGFRVLQLTSMPSVLIEAGFLSNKKDKKRLTSKKGQRKIAHKIFGACLEYLSDLNEIEAQASPSSVVQYHPMPRENDVFEATTKEDLKSKAQYAIQIASYNNVAPINVSKKWKELSNIEIIQEGNKFRYIVGSFDSKVEADEKLEYLVQNGFKDAFVFAKIQE